MTPIARRMRPVIVDQEVDVLVCDMCGSESEEPVSTEIAYPAGWQNLAAITGDVWILCQKCQTEVLGFMRSKRPQEMGFL